MKLSLVVVGVLAVCAISLAEEAGPLMALLRPVEESQLVAVPQPREKRSLLLGAGVLGAAALGAGLIGAKAGFVGGALAGGALSGRSYGGWGHGGYGGYGGYGHGGYGGYYNGGYGGYYGGGYGGYGRAYRSYPSTYYVSDPWC